MVMPVIIAGGKGMRLWPVSRESVPKPFVSVASGTDTLLQATLRRLWAIEDLSTPIVVCNAAHESLVREQADRLIGQSVNLLLEPESRNTAPAICAAALVAERLAGENEPVLVLPADHIIKNEAAFAGAVKSGVSLARKGYLATFAIKPSEAATGYGYLKIGEPIDLLQQQFRLEAFVEKPDRQRADQFVASGLYAWNSGMFAFEPRVLIEAFNRFQPEILAGCKAALAGCSLGPVIRLSAKAFANVPSISIDYAIMEQAPNVATVVADMGWSDVGDWEAIWQLAEKDVTGVASRGNVLSLDSSDSLLQSDGPLLVGLGLQDMVAVATRDAVFVSPRSLSQDVKRVVDKLTTQGRPEAVTSTRVYRPWGCYEQIHVGPGFQVKKISVNPGAKLSLQRHWYRAEHWVCIAGEGIVTRGEEQISIGVNQAVDIPVGAIHRLENSGVVMIHIIEVQIGSYTGEDDIERIADIYGRT